MKDRYIREGTEIIMGEYIMPKDNWTSLFNHQRRQRAERLLVQTKHEAEEEEETRPSSSISDVQNCQPSFNYIAPMSNEHDIAELTWENGQLAFHGFNGLFPSSCPTKPLQTWERTGDTLESVVQLATTGSRRLANSITNPAVENTSKNNNSHEDLIIPNVVGSVVASSGGLNCCNQTQSSSGQVQLSVGNDQINCCVGRKGSFFSFSGEELQDQRACASASAAFCGEINNRSDNDTTVMTGASLDSSKMVTDEDSASDHALLGKEQKMKAETVSGRTSATRRRRAAAIHNQSERKRRDRINQKMKALQKLVPRASKTDKASMLDEVIEYLKQLQAQVQMMASTRTMSQLMMPLGMQQQLQMSIPAQMGAEVDPRSGMGIGMLDMGKVNAATSSMPQHLSPGIHTFPFAPPSFLVPSMLPLQQPNQDPRNSASSGMQNPYHAFLAQSIDMEMYNRMAAVYRQQMHQAMGAITGDQHLQSNSMHQGSTLR